MRFLALLLMTTLLWCLLLAGAGFAALPRTQLLPTASPYLTRCHSERNEMKRKNLILKNIFTGQLRFLIKNMNLFKERFHLFRKTESPKQSILLPKFHTHYLTNRRVRHGFRGPLSLESRQKIHLEFVKKDFLQLFVQG